MKVAKENGFVFNSQKCMIGEKSIPFFGMMYDDDRGTPRPRANRGYIRATPAQTNKASLQQYLGIATYMAPFIPQLADLTAPLRTRPHEIGHRLPVDYVISTGIRASSTSDYHSHYACVLRPKKAYDNTSRCIRQRHMGSPTTRQEAIRIRQQGSGRD